MSAGDRFIAHDTSFRKVTGSAARLVTVVGCDAHEGPVYRTTDKALYVTSLPAPGRPAVIKRIALDDEHFPLPSERVTTVASGTVMPNGMALDHHGCLVVCEQGDRDHDACISRVDPATGERVVVAHRWRGQRFNSPNDVVVAGDGALWFTDPAYGYLQGFRPEPEVGDFVYRCDPDSGAVDVVADGFDKPNGIALSPDGSTLYVTDSGANQAAGTFDPARPHHLVSFTVTAGRRLTGRRVVAVTAPGFPDGLKVDADGRLYVSSSSGVLVLSPEGDLLGEIVVPGAVNFTWGGAGGNVLLITADTAVWAAVLAVAGPAAATRRAGADNLSVSVPVTTGA